MKFSAYQLLLLNVFLIGPVVAQSGPMTIGSPHQNVRRSNTTTIDSRLYLPDMRMVLPKQGYIVMSNRLLWSDNNGQTWSDVTPRTEGMENLDAALFLDNSTGWVVQSQFDATAGKMLVGIGFTSDHGRNWQHSTPRIPASLGINYSGRAGIYFIDRLHGWVLLPYATSANFSRAELLSTSDGGQSWQDLPQPPISGRIRFTSVIDGWLAGGVGSNELYRTSDGGRTWVQIQVTTPSEIDTWLSYDSPVFDDRLHGSLTITVSSAMGSLVQVFTTDDGGHSWKRTAQMPLQKRTGPGVVVPTTVLNGQTILATVHDLGIRLRASRDARVIESTTKEVGPDTNIRNLQFSTALDAWAVVSDARCAASAEVCLLATSDGGTHWAEITPTLSVSAASSPQARLIGDRGFDAACAPRVADLKAWWDDPSRPHIFMNVYFGGNDRYRGCRALNDSTITTTYMQEVSRMGWGIVPTWVGPQAPGFNPGEFDVINANPQAAQDQGISEAKAAAIQAAKIGLTNGAIIYYDMEGTYSQSQTTRNAVNGFVNGWVKGLHDNGYLAGVYAQAANVSDYASVTYVPDAVWIVHVVNRRIINSVYDLEPLVRDDLWANHQRIVQYVDTHNETHNNVTLSIDSNLADGIVVQVGTSVELIQNGSFLSGFSSWLVPEWGNSPGPALSNVNAHAGHASACLGTPLTFNEPSGSSTFFQWVTIPDNIAAPTLFFWYKGWSTDSSTDYDGQEIKIWDPDRSEYVWTSQFLDNSQRWKSMSVNLWEYRGRRIGVVFNVYQDGASDPTGMCVDGVSLSYRTGQLPRSNISLTFAPNPVTAARDGDWYYTSSIRDLAGVALTIIRMSIDGVDYSDNIKDWFGSNRLDIHGELSADIHSWRYSAPGGYPLDSADPYR